MKKIFTLIAAAATCVALSTAVMAADAMKGVDSALDKTSTTLDKADKKEADLKEKAAKKDAAMKEKAPKKEAALKEKAAKKESAMKEKAAKKEAADKARQKKIDDQAARINQKKDAAVKDATDRKSGIQDLKKESPPGLPANSCCQC